MADRQIRRTLKRTRANESGSDSSNNNVAVKQRPEQNDDRSANTSNRVVVVEPDRVERVSVVEVEPESIGEFIASGGTDSTTSERDSDGGGARRRRADAGIKRGKRGKKEAIANIEAVVTMVHTWASVLLKTPEIMLAPEEVKQLSESYTEFCEWHDVPVLTPKRMSEINLIACAFSLYGTRFVAISRRKKEERKRTNLHVMQPMRQEQRQPVM